MDDQPKKMVGAVQLVPVNHEYVWRYRSIAAAEGVSLKEGTHGTRWWRTGGSEGFGGACILSSKKAQIKGLFIHPEWRGQGIGRAMTYEIFLLLREEFEVISVFTARQDVYEPWGFVTQRTVRGSTVYMEWK